MKLGELPQAYTFLDNEGNISRIQRQRNTSKTLPFLSFIKKNKILIVAVFRIDIIQSLNSISTY